MIGLIKGLFGSKPKVKVVDAEQVEPAVPVQKGAFYLNVDDAKTLGDIEYMRTAKTVRRSFPKEKLGQDNEFVQAISAMGKMSDEVSPGSAAVTDAKTVQTEAEIAQRRQSDTSMDMFRNMARDMRKR